MDAEDVVVGREHVHGGRIVRGVHLDRNLRVVDAREVAGTSWLVLLWLKSEGVRVDAWVRRASVVVVRLHLVEVLTLLLLEAVLAVEDKLEGVEGTHRLLSEGGVTTTGTDLHHGGTREGGGHEGVRRLDGSLVRLEDDVGGNRRSGEVPEGVLGRGVGEAPDELLDWVVVGEADLLCRRRGDGVGAGVLDLLDEVLVTLLREAATLLGVEVDVVRPHLEDGLVEEGLHVGREVEVDADLVVLEGDEGEVETGVAVEEEDEGEVHRTSADTGIRGSGHLTPSGLLGLVQVKLGVHAPPLLVVLVDALTTNGKLNVVDGTLRDEVAVTRISSLGSRDSRLEFDVHVTDEITVARNSDRHATGVRGSTVDGLLDVLHREVGVALVFRLEEGHLRVTGKVDILGAVRYELHETTGHFESCCTIGRENNSAKFRDSIFLSQV